MEGIEEIGGVDPVVVGGLMQQLQEALSLESKYQPALDFPGNTKDKKDVTRSQRDGTAHVIRCLKIWYDLPSEVFFISTHLMDMFLTKMRVKSKHMACMSIASFQLASRMVCGGSAPELGDVLSISQAKCSVADLVRMQGVVASKLATAPTSPWPLTSGNFLHIYHSLLSAVDTHQVYARIVNELELKQLLEVVLCDATCCNFRPSELALATFCSALDAGVARLTGSPPPAQSVLRLVSFIQHIQQKAWISEASFMKCHSAVLHVLRRYNRGEFRTQDRQRLTWKVSSRTLRHLRPVTRLIPTLQTIYEDGQLQIHRPRSRNTSSSSSSSEDISTAHPRHYSYYLTRLNLPPMFQASF